MSFLQIYHFSGGCEQSFHRSKITSLTSLLSHQFLQWSTLVHRIEQKQKIAWTPTTEGAIWQRLRESVTRYVCRLDDFTTKFNQCECRKQRSMDYNLHLQFETEGCRCISLEDIPKITWDMKDLTMPSSTNLSSGKRRATPPLPGRFWHMEPGPFSCSMSLCFTTRRHDTFSSSRCPSFVRNTWPEGMQLIPEIEEGQRPWNASGGTGM